MSFSSSQCIDQLDAITIPHRQFLAQPQASDTDYTPLYVPQSQLITTSNQKISQAPQLVDSKLRNIPKANTTNLRRTDPFFKLSDKYSLDSLVFNCIDTVYDVKQNNYLMLGEGPGGWAQYMQHSINGSQGYGITLPGDNNWDFDQLEVISFKFMYGGTGSGNISTERDWLISNVNDIQLVTSDITPQTSQLLVDAAIIALSVLNKKTEQTYITTVTQPRTLEEKSANIPPPNALKTAVDVGGNLVFRIDDTTSAHSAHVIFLITRCFSENYLYKPVVSLAHTPTRYLVCKGYNGENGSIDALKGLDKSIIFDTHFTEWLTHCNNQFGSRQLDAVNELNNINAVGVIGRDLSRLLFTVGARGSMTTDIY